MKYEFMKYELSKIKVKSKDYYDNLFGGAALKGIVQNTYIEGYAEAVNDAAEWLREQLREYVNEGYGYEDIIDPDLSEAFKNDLLE